MPLKQVIDVALGLACRNGAWLMDRRETDDQFHGLWEFPGGKMRQGETAAEAAARECREELGVLVEPVRTLEAIEHDYGDSVVRLHPVLCKWLGGDLPRNSRWKRAG